MAPRIRSLLTPLPPRFHFFKGRNLLQVDYRLTNRAGGTKPRWGEGLSLDTDCEAEDEV